MQHLDLFSGIGGFALAAEMVWSDVVHEFCDFDPFCQAILHKHWPHAEIYGDIKTFHPKARTVDLLTGGFPCQPFSSAGKRRGTEDDRHLWPEMLRVIREASPRWLIGENVGGLLTWDGGMVLESVLSDLEGAGYEAWPFVIPACAVDAPHRRDRVWIVANAIGSDAGRATGADARPSAPKRLRQRHAVELSGEPGEVRLSTDTTRSGWREGQPQRSGLREIESTVGTQERRGFTNLSGHEQWQEQWPQALARLCPVDDGLPPPVVRPRGWRNAALKAAGNSIVPQVAAAVMRAIDL